MMTGHIDYFQIFATASVRCDSCHFDEPLCAFVFLWNPSVRERGHLESSLMSRVLQLSQALCQCSRSPACLRTSVSPLPPRHDMPFLVPGRMWIRRINLLPNPIGKTAVLREPLAEVSGKRLERAGDGRRSVFRETVLVQDREARASLQHRPA